MEEEEPSSGTVQLERKESLPRASRPPPDPRDAQLPNYTTGRGVSAERLGQESHPYQRICDVENCFFGKNRSSLMGGAIEELNHTW